MKKRFIFKIIRAAIYTIILLIGGILLLPILPSKTWFTSFTIISGSMAPIIPAGSIVLVQKTPNVVLGDIVAFTQPTDTNTTIVHRIISQDLKDGTISYTTKGDNNNAADNWSLKKDEVKGKVILSIPLIGYLQSIIRKPIGFALVIGLPLLYFAYKNILLIGQGINEVKGKGKKSRTLKIVILGAGIILMSTLLHDSSAALALFTSQSTINNISIYAILAPSPTVTPTLTPTPTTVPGGGIVIDISGNGAGSNNNVEIEINQTTTMNQNNTTIITNQQSSTANTGGNLIR